MARTDNRQLGLPLPLPPALGRADFMPSACNALALRLISEPSGFPDGRLILHGPEGSGKTHLAAIWAEERGARWLEPMRLADELPALLASTEPQRFVLDAAEQIAGSIAEEALFHLINHLAATRGAILLTARAPAHGWGVRLADLASRLEASTHVGLGPPDDTLVIALLVKLFADRQIEVSPELIVWLSRRIERSFAAARRVVDVLDAEALRLRRPVSRALAEEVLAELPQTRETLPASRPEEKGAAWSCGAERLNRALAKRTFSP